MEAIQEWFLSLGAEYGVNPIIFGAIYVGAIPFFTLSVAWLIRNKRKNKSLALPVLSASFFFVSAYLYLIIVGENIPSWVYLFIGVMIIYGGLSTYRKIKTKVSDE